ncbi:MAG: response regulator [Firmicutes bacterium]|nr:response regulator [Bacillota bacterium]
MNIIWLQITSFVYMTVLLILFFSKERLQSLENSIFRNIMIVNEIGLLIELACFYTVSNLNTSNIINVLVTKALLIYYLIYILLFTYYIAVITYRKREDAEKIYKKTAILCTLYFVINTLLLSALPLYYSTGAHPYSYGPAVNYLYTVYTILICIWVIFLVINHNTIKRKEFIPVFILIILGTIAGIIQKSNPSLVIMTALDTLVTFIMYFTIENPDIKMIEQLELARDAADKANAAKTDFLSSMSHEIRTPLNAIVGFSDCINESDSLEEAKENAKDIINASETLLEIVNGILDISKIEAGKLEIVNSTYNGKELFEELAKLIRPRMDDKGLDFTYYIAPDIPEVLYGDHANLKKIVTNLLSNASKYTDTGFVRYEVNCVRSVDTCKLIISVEDSGRGIKKESLDKLFTKFQRLDEDRNTTIEGTGLGLAITKQLIELMGGKIIVHTIYGEGSKFTVVLNQKIDKSQTNAKQTNSSNSLKDTLELAGRKLLLVDDNSLNLKVATKLLEKFNADNIECVESGFACIDRIVAGNDYDVILLDDMMPKMSGVETLKKLKEIPGFNTPVVALTANAITGMKDKYLEAGFDDYLAKPIEKNQLIIVLNKILDNKPHNTAATLMSKTKTDLPKDITPAELTEEELSQTQKLRPIKEEVETLDVPTESDIEVEGNDVSTSDETYDEAYLRKNGVDMDNALELLGDMEMYNDTLKDYLSEIDNKLEELRGYKESNDMPNYSVLVHSMKSDAKYLGFMKFAEVAYEHELKSKEGNSDFVNGDFARLEEELNKVLKIAKEYGSHI